MVNSKSCERMLQLQLDTQKMRVKNIVKPVLDNAIQYHIDHQNVHLCFIGPVSSLLTVLNFHDFSVKGS